MKAQLVKRQDRFDLYNKSDGSKIASTLPNPMGKLSLKNCEAIENGYDLDELAEEYAEENAKDDNISHHNLCTPLEYAYRYGFQKALEILGDKKFSEKDMIKALSAGLSIGYGRQFEIENKQVEIDSYIKSLQQTEWDVTFNPDEKDSDGCLILRRQNEI